MPAVVDKSSAAAVQQAAAPSMTAPLRSSASSSGSGAAPAPSGAAPYSGGVPSGPAATAAGMTGFPGAADPTYLAYMRQMGVEESTQNALLGHRVGALTRELARGLPAYAVQRERAIENTGNTWEDRGMYRSGNRIKGQFDAASDVDRERMDFEARIRDQIAEQYIMTAVDVAEMRRQLMEAGLDGASATAIANAQAGL